MERTPGPRHTPPPPPPQQQPHAAPGPAPTLAAPVARRKRQLEVTAGGATMDADDDVRWTLFGAYDRGTDDEARERGYRGSLPDRPLPAFFADVHSGLQSGMVKSRRLTGTDSQSPGMLSREVLAGAPPCVGRMSEPLATKSSSGHPSSSVTQHQQTTTSFSTSQLDNFRLDAPTISEQKENKARVTKPVPKRSLHTTSLSTPKIQPALPNLSQFLSPRDVQRTVTSLHRTVLGVQFPKTEADDSKPSFTSWRRDQNEPLSRADSDSHQQPESADMEGEDESDQYSSDEEFCMENEISLSQDKLNNLSVHDIPDHLLEDEDNQDSGTSESDGNDITLQLSRGFANALTSQEANALGAAGLVTMALTKLPSPIIIGRDQYYSVFGEKIRGQETFHLSRRHCIFHVTRVDGSPSTASYKIVVENTSTNGLDVNGRSMKHGERQELHVGDVVTLLKIRNQGSDGSLSYVVSSLPNLAQVSHADKSVLGTAQGNDVFRARTCAEKANVTPPSKTSKLTGIATLPRHPQLVFPHISTGIFIADPFIANSEQSQKPLRGLRDELTAIMSPLSGITHMKVLYESATIDSFTTGCQSSNDILVYAGACNDAQLIMEDQNGMLSLMSLPELSDIAATTTPKLVIIFARSIAAAQLFVDAGFQHVLFVNSRERCRSKAASYFRALFASILKGNTVQRSHIQARKTALGVSVAENAECLCGILPGGQNHDILLGNVQSPGTRAGDVLSVLNSALIPALTPFFMSREDTIAEVIGSLRRDHVQLCTVRGGKGIGKSSIAVYVAKYAMDRRWYKCGVHYVDVEADIVPAEPSPMSVTLGLSSENNCRERSRQALLRLQADVDDLLQHIQIDKNDAENSALLILDGCDCINVAQLRDFIVKTIQSFPGVQILLTSRQDLRVNTHTRILAEKIISVQALNAQDSAVLFQNVAKSCLSPDRFRKVLPFGENLVDRLAKHPALTRLNGNPLFVTRTAFELRSRDLADLE